ncbi:hypothetical protein AB1282_20045 [Gottfriedia sp. S16(2024)]|uniref:hypothetical protein n=1 Tax=Gottfriedia sp. S16(2024) TaxID=3162883 RepID=UPI003D1D335F
MNKLFLIGIFSVPLIFVLNGCQEESSKEKDKPHVLEVKNNEKQSLDVSESVWDQLTSKDKNHIQGDWKKARVQQIILRDSMGMITDKKFIGKEVFIVNYPSNDNPTIGDFVVYADLKSHKLIGYGYRD